MFAPESVACLHGWQRVLRARPPPLLAPEAWRTAASPPADVAIRAAVRRYFGDAAATTLDGTARWYRAKLAEFVQGGSPDF